MKVRITVDLDEVARLAIAERVGLPRHALTGERRPADHGTCRRLLSGLLNADLEVIVSEYEAECRSSVEAECGR